MYNSKNNVFSKINIKNGNMYSYLKYNKFEKELRFSYKEILPKQEREHNGPQEGGDPATHDKQ